MGISEEECKKDVRILANVSCTTNCLAPIAKLLDVYLVYIILSALTRVNDKYSYKRYTKKSNLRFNFIVFNDYCHDQCCFESGTQCF